MSACLPACSEPARWLSPTAQAALDGDDERVGLTGVVGEFDFQLTSGAAAPGG